MSARGTVLLIAALGFEAAPLRALVDGTPEPLPGARRAWRGRLATTQAWVVESGMGADRAARAATAALERGRASVVISTGCAGALREDLASGDVIVASETRSPLGARASDPAWIARYERAARQAALRVEQGPIWTADAVVATPEAKRRLGVEQGCLAVEMEGAAIAAVAARHGVPFVAVRTILEPLDVAIPEGLFDENARPRPIRIAARIAREPRLARTLAFLGRASRRTGGALGALHRAALDDFSASRA